MLVLSLPAAAAVLVPVVVVGKDVADEMDVEDVTDVEGEMDVEDVEDEVAVDGEEVRQRHLLDLDQVLPSQLPLPLPSLHPSLRIAGTF